MERPDIFERYRKISTTEPVITELKGGPSKEPHLRVEVDGRLDFDRKVQMYSVAALAAGDFVHSGEMREQKLPDVAMFYGGIVGHALLTTPKEHRRDFLSTLYQSIQYALERWEGKEGANRLKDNEGKE